MLHRNQQQIVLIHNESNGNRWADHFVDVNKSIPIPKGGPRIIDDLLLTRYACYLIAQNVNPRMEEIAIQGFSL